MGTIRRTLGGCQEGLSEACKTHGVEGGLREDGGNPWDGSVFTEVPSVMKVTAIELKSSPQRM